MLAFVIIGRASHADGESLSGIASTAWPFLAGLGIGWLATRAWRRPLALSPAGLGAWLGAAGLGMVLRVVAGQGTAVAFVGRGAGVPRAVPARLAVGFPAVQAVTGTAVAARSKPAVMLSIWASR